jgi:hypothetical protein
MTIKPSDFPADENGDVLRRMQRNGDDLSKPRDIDFTVVMPNEDSVHKFSDHFRKLGFQEKSEESDTVPELPWDVIVVKHMIPEHADITAFELQLEEIASPLGGRNDGWGCFEQK